MKKIVLVFILFSSICYGQDTLVFKNGEKKVAKIIVLGDKVIYSLPPATKKYKVNKSELSKISYSDTSMFLIKFKPKALCTNMNSDAFNINAGIGFSTIQWEFTDFISGAGTPAFISVTPVYSATVDYGIIDKFSFGAGVAWQSILDNPNIGGDNIAYNVTEHMTRTNVAMRLLGHFGKDTTLDFYYGLRLGMSIWTDNVTTPSNIPPLPTAYYSKKDLSAISLQVLFGFRYYFSNIIGIHFETGLGTPFFLEGGLTFRISTQ